MSSFDRQDIVSYTDDEQNIVEHQRAIHDANFFRISKPNAQIETMGKLTGKIADMMRTKAKKR